MITFFTKLLAMIFAVVMLTACAPTPEKIIEEGGARLDGAELQALYGSGMSMNWTAAPGTSGTAVYAPDGAANVKFGSSNWVGTWRIDGDTFCASYPERDNGADRCFTLVRHASGSYSWFKSDGAHGGDFTVNQ